MIGDRLDILKQICTVTIHSFNDVNGQVRWRFTAKRNDNDALPEVVEESPDVSLAILKGLDAATLAGWLDE